MLNRLNSSSVGFSSLDIYRALLDFSLDSSTLSISQTFYNAGLRTRFKMYFAASYVLRFFVGKKSITYISCDDV